MSNMRLLALGCLVLSAAFASSEPPSLYDPDPQHPWNRVYDALFLRGFDGGEEQIDQLFRGVTPREFVDPLLWSSSKYLLAKSSHSKTISLLDEAIAAQNAEPEVDLTKRALFQRDLWSVFIWAADRKRQLRRHDDPLAEPCSELMDRLAVLMEAVALTPEDFDSLVAGFPPVPDTTYGWTEPAIEIADVSRLDAWYEKLRKKSDDAGTEPNWERIAWDVKGILAASRRPVSPVLGNIDEDWLIVGVDGAKRPMAMSHAVSFGARSVFYIAMRMPGGREETTSYLASLSGVLAEKELRRRNPPRAVRIGDPPVPVLPETPPSTIIALIRRPLSILRSGALVVLPFIETVQFFEHGEQEFPHPLLVGRTWRTAVFGEFRLARKNARKDLPYLVPTQDTAGEIPTLFRSHGIDWYENGRSDVKPVKLDCRSCHGNPLPTIRTMQSLKTINDVRESDGTDSILTYLVSSQDEQDKLMIDYAKSTAAWTELTFRWTSKQ